MAGGEGAKRGAHVDRGLKVGQESCGAAVHGAEVHKTESRAREVVERSELIRKQDEWGQIRIRESKYTSGQVDGNWNDEMRADFAAWHVENK